MRTRLNRGGSIPRYAGIPLRRVIIGIESSAGFLFVNDGEIAPGDLSNPARPESHSPRYARAARTIGRMIFSLMLPAGDDNMNSPNRTLKQKAYHG